MSPWHARYAVYANPEASERKHTPYLLDVQSDYSDALTTRVVVSGCSEAAFGLSARNLNTSFRVARHVVVLDTAAMGTMPLSELR